MSSHKKKSRSTNKSEKKARFSRKRGTSKSFNARTPTGAVAKVPTHATVATFLSSFKSDDIKSKIKSLVTHDDRKLSTPDSQTMAVHQSLMDPLQVYPVRLGGYTSANITAGIVDVFVSADPSPSGWASPEWSALASLFAEFKLHSLTLHICRNYIGAPAPTPSTDGKGNLAVASNLGLATNAGSYAQIADNADVRWYNQFDTSVSGISHTMSSTQIGWSETLTPTTQPYAGAPGCIQLYSNNGVTTPTGGILYQIIISGIYLFRVRT